MTFLLSAAAALVLPCPRPRVVDGDTLRCGKERVRLLGVDAPELHGCGRGRTCVAGDPVRSRRSLEKGARLGPVSYQVIKRDRYGRAIAVAWAGKVNLSCWQLRRNEAVYVRRWDEGRRVARGCL